MKRLATAILLSAATLLLSACGSKVEVPPAHVGKILTKNGYAADTIPPSKFRLPFCVSHCDKLVTLEASDRGFEENLKVFMPQDKLNLNVEIRGTMSIPTTPSVVDAIFDRVVADNDRINLHTVYMTYGRQSLLGVVRSELTKHSIQEVMENRESISGNIHATLQEKMSETATPLIISRFELADVQPPQVIIDAQESAKEREIDIQKAEANAMVEMVEAEKALEIARKDRLVEREKAEAIAEQNRIAAASVTPQLLEYRRLEVQERIYSALASSKNEGLIVVPFDGTAVNSVVDASVFGRVAGKEMKQ